MKSPYASKGSVQQAAVSFNAVGSSLLLSKKMRPAALPPSLRQAVELLKTQYVDYTGAFLLQSRIEADACADAQSHAVAFA